VDVRRKNEVKEPGSGQEQVMPLTTFAARIKGLAGNICSRDQQHSFYGECFAALAQSGSYFTHTVQRRWRGP
jgi:hypothetical protein